MSQEIILNFTTEINTSVQVGDIVYFTPTTPQGSSPDPYASSGAAVTTELGFIVAIDILSPTGYIIKVLTDLAVVPGASDFISFGKDRTANTTSLIGYYMEVKFVNNSRDKVELFSVGSQVVESSK